MNDSLPVIVSAVRTAIGRKGGALAGYQASELGGIVIREAVARAGVAPEDITDVILGNTLSPQGNVARVASLHAGLGESVPALTIDRQCGSGINSVALAAQAVLATGGIYVAGGAESMTNEPHQLARSARAYDAQPPRFLRRELAPAEIGDPVMGITAENLAADYGISRSAQDAYALESQKRMAAAQARGAFDEHLVGVAQPDGSLFLRDEHPRADSSIEKLASLRSVFDPEGSVTAGNASGINDGAAATVVMSRAEANARGITPLATITGWAVAGVDPTRMGIGPVPAVRKLLAATGQRLEDFDLVELNEAFAAQVLACQEELRIPAEKLNVLGGAIAHGHPIAATGTMLIAKIITELGTRGLRRGLVTACIGGGQGIALSLEREIPGMDAPLADLTSAESATRSQA
ncbi:MULTISPECIES: thiolase family protein [unclassified Leucobacter]|uniref:thiolase family protein n=1 Tax=unclassified Leucobacter TaxID=2621730 RepID=UPI00165DA157|nr:MULTISPECIES: thiolase family protein [unclassified Leucobacter]MBC9926277.1 thiolase family protein [Leucobacter sp. cx-169]